MKYSPAIVAMGVSRRDAIRRVSKRKTRQHPARRQTWAGSVFLDFDSPCRPAIPYTEAIHKEPSPTPPPTSHRTASNRQLPLAPSGRSTRPVPNPRPVPHKNKEHGAARFRNITLLLATLGKFGDLMMMCRPASALGLRKAWASRASLSVASNPADAKSVSHLRHAAGLTGGWWEGAGRAAQLGRPRGGLASLRLGLFRGSHRKEVSHGHGLDPGAGVRAVPSRHLPLGIGRVMSVTPEL